MDNNPLAIIQAIKNPKQFCMNMLKSNSNPMLQNLFKMAEKNDVESIKNFGRNLYKQSGRNFDEEFEQFSSVFNNK